MASISRWRAKTVDGTSKRIQGRTLKILNAHPENILATDDKQNVIVKWIDSQMCRREDSVQVCLRLAPAAFSGSGQWSLLIRSRESTLGREALGRMLANLYVET